MRDISSMTDKELMTGSIIFVLLSSIDPKYQGGKLGRKQILKALKKVLMTYAHSENNNNKEHYLDIISKCDECMYKARDSMVAEIGDKGYYINPGSLLQILVKRYPKYIEIYDLKERHIDNIYEHYKEAGIGFYSIKYANKLIKEINLALGIEDTVENVKY